MSSPLLAERILSPSSKDTTMATTPPQKPKGGVRPKQSPPGDVELSVFDILNIFRHHWFLSRPHLLANAISAQKAEDGNISWVEFTPQFHSHLVKCAVALVPHPVHKVKKVMFGYILELLNGDGHLAFSNSRRAAARPIMPKRRSGVLHGSGAVLLSEKGNGKLRKRPNNPLVSGNAWHADESSTPAKPPASTSAPNPKWLACQGKQPVDRPHKPHH
ncbi:hypothetical protein F5888DRAFT_1872570 [Russula emetica]|nr:hypothetical protein F5888DRAFT_1872570 [Russula emetica]